MAYAELTTEQKASLDAWMTLLRASVGELARANCRRRDADPQDTGGQLDSGRTVETTQ